jgi:endogenous inhibitor of DNA gyrase (YacG/DUF329 family)
MPTFLCPVCDAPVDPKNTATLPFCSDRCRQIDLGRWLGERYGVPAPNRRDPEEYDPEEADAEE